MNKQQRGTSGVAVTTTKPSPLSYSANGTTSVPQDALARILLDRFAELRETGLAVEPRISTSED